MGWLSPSSWWKKLIKLLHIISNWELIDPNSRAGRALRDTKLSGVKEAMKPKISFYRQVVFWSCFFCCLTYGIVGCIATVNKYLEDPTLKSLHEGIPIENAFDPSLTINRLYHYDLFIVQEAKELQLKTKYQNVVTDVYGQNWTEIEAVKLNEMMHHNCQSKRSTGVRFKASKADQTFPLDDKRGNNVELQDNPRDPVYKNKIIPFILRGTINCSEVIGACVINGSPVVHCDTKFQLVQTEIGVACSTNQIPDHILRRDVGIKTLLRNSNEVADNHTNALWKTFNIDEYPFRDEERRKTDPNVLGNVPSRTTLAGLGNGHTQVLRFKKNETQACHTFDCEGYYVSASPPHEAPQPLSNGILVQKNMEVFIKTKVQITMAHRAMIEHIPIDKRECVLQHESKLKYHTVYSEYNCQQECLATIISNKCNCSELTATAGRNETLCGRVHQVCVDKAKVELHKKGYTKECAKVNMKCYPACNQVKYASTAVFAPLKKENFGDPSLLGVNETTEDWSIVHHFIEHQMIEAYEIVLYSNSNELFASLGGILGLSNGIDIIGIVNIFIGVVSLIMMFLELLYLLVTMGCAAEAFVICYNKNCVAPPPELPEQQPLPIDKNYDDDDEDDENGGNQDGDENAITEQPTASSTDPSNPPNRQRHRRTLQPSPTDSLPISPNNGSQRQPEISENEQPEDSSTGPAIAPEADEPILPEDNEDSTEKDNTSGGLSSQTDCFSRLLPTGARRSSQPVNTDPRNNIRKPKRPFNSAQAKFKSPGPITQQPRSNRQMKSAPISSAHFTNKIVPSHQRRPQTSGNRNSAELSCLLLPRVDLDETERFLYPTDFPLRNFTTGARRSSLPTISESTFSDSVRRMPRPFNSAQAKNNLMSGGQLNASTLIQPYNSPNQIGPTRVNNGEEEPRNIFWIRSASQRPDHVSFQIDDEDSDIGLRDYEEGRKTPGGAIAYQETAIDTNLGGINSDISTISQRVRNINRTMHRLHQD